jgi:hypothetical protein
MMMMIHSPFFIIGVINDAQFINADEYMIGIINDVQFVNADECIVCVLYMLMSILFVFFNMLMSVSFV